MPANKTPTIILEQWEDTLGPLRLSFNPGTCEIELSYCGLNGAWYAMPDPMFEDWTYNVPVFK